VTEFDDFMTDRELALEKEGIDVQPMFKYQVTINGGSNFYCQQVTEERMGERTCLKLTDVWVRDVALTTRLVPWVRAVVAEYDVALLRAES
jgi:hypothetical protein